MQPQTAAAPPVVEAEEQVGAGEAEAAAMLRR